MGLFGPEVRLIEGEEYTLESVTESRSAADSFANMTRTYGFKARIKPVLSNNKTLFQVWVSLNPSTPIQSPTMAPGQVKQ